MNHSHELRATGQWSLKEDGGCWCTTCWTMTNWNKAKNKKAMQIAYEQSMLSTPGDPNELNLSQGLARTVMDQIIEYKCQEQARNEALIQWEQELVNRNREIFDNCLKMTAGVPFWAGKVNLSNGTVVDRVREQHQKRIEKQLAAMAKSRSWTQAKGRSCTGKGSMPRELEHQWLASNGLLVQATRRW